MAELKEITTKHKKNDNDCFIERFRTQMKTKGWSHKRFAKESGLSSYAVDKIASGISVPMASTLIDICLTLNVSADYLLGLSDIENIK